MFITDERSTRPDGERARHERLVATMAHELRTPLFAVEGLLEAIEAERAGALDDGLARDLATIGTAVQEALRIVEDQLDLVAAGAGTVGVRRAPVDVAALLGEVADLAAAFPRSPRVTVHVEPAPVGLPGLVSDRGKIAQVLRNLVGNALKFTAAGEVRVWAEAGAGERVRFVVADTGPGLPCAGDPEIRPSVTGLPGTGLGLGLCEEFAAALDGRLEITSRAGVGTMIALDLAAAPTLVRV